MHFKCARSNMNLIWRYSCKYHKCFFTSSFVSTPLPLHSCSWTRVRRRCCRCPSRSRATTPPPHSPPSPPCWSPSTPSSLQAKAFWKKLMRSAFRNPNKISPFTVNGMSQLCGFISWLFKINYFNTFVTCVSCLWSLKFDQQVPFPSPPSSHSSENSTMAEWSCPHSPLSPHPPICWWCWAWSPTPPPRPCSATPPPSSLPSFAGNTYLKQEISKSKYFLIWNWIRSSKSCLSINSPMICYEEFWWCLVWARPATPPRPTL